MSFPNLTRLFFFSALVAASGASASDFQSARTAGLGGSGHAAPILTDAIYMNPAMIAFLNAYSVTVTRNSYSGPDSHEPKGALLNASIQDGTNSLLAAGVGYTRKSFGKEVTVGASSRLFQNYGIGIGGKFLFGSESKDSAQDATVSALGSPLPWLQTSVIVDNALQTTKSKQWGLSREIILGVKVNVEKLMLIYFDPHLVPTKPAGDSYGYELGAEIPLFTDFYIRGGINRNSFQTQLNQYGRGHGFGVGWSFPRLSLDAAMTRTISPARTNNFLISITII
ncbi:MAG: hypothetical protein H7301_06100 [Cryobacterium sp.]|nr:hypothetical protein [Oligoflexia bacterium]